VKIYLAARYSRREELCGYREELRDLGHDVQARWLDGKHQLTSRGQSIGEGGEAVVEGVADGSSQVEDASLRGKFAKDDLDDVKAAELLVAFTEAPRSNSSRGGRHVEFGIALALGIRLITVGPRENIFHWLPVIEQFNTWGEAKKAIAPTEEKK
jgi:hypothetical protein